MLARERALRIALAEARAGVVEKREDFSKRITKYQAADSFARGHGLRVVQQLRRLVLSGGTARADRDRPLGQRATDGAARQAADGWSSEGPRGATSSAFSSRRSTRPSTTSASWSRSCPTALSARSRATRSGTARGLEGVFVKMRAARVSASKFIRVPGQVPDGIGRGDHGGEVRDLQKQLVEARAQEARGRRRVRREDREAVESSSASTICPRRGSPTPRP